MNLCLQCASWLQTREHFFWWDNITHNPTWMLSGQRWYCPALYHFTEHKCIMVSQACASPIAEWAGGTLKGTDGLPRFRLQAVNCIFNCCAVWKESLRWKISIARNMVGCTFLPGVHYEKAVQNDIPLLDVWTGIVQTPSSRLLDVLLPI